MKITNKMVILNELWEIEQEYENPVTFTIGDDRRRLKYEFHKNDENRKNYATVTDIDEQKIVLEIDNNGNIIEYDEQWLNEPYGPFEFLEIQCNR